MEIVKELHCKEVIHIPSGKKYFVPIAHYNEPYGVYVRLTSNHHYFGSRDVLFDSLEDFFKKGFIIL